MAYALFCDRKGVPWIETGGYLPPWVADLRLAEIYSPESVGVNLMKWIWFRRALVYAEAQSCSYKFEIKK